MAPDSPLLVCADACVCGSLWVSVCVCVCVGGGGGCAGVGGFPFHFLLFVASSLNLWGWCHVWSDRHLLRQSRGGHGDCFHLHCQALQTIRMNMNLNRPRESLRQKGAENPCCSQFLFLRVVIVQWLNRQAGVTVWTDTHPSIGNDWDRQASQCGHRYTHPSSNGALVARSRAGPLALC